MPALPRETERGGAFQTELLILKQVQVWWAGTSFCSWVNDDVMQQTHYFLNGFSRLPDLKADRVKVNNPDHYQHFSPLTCIIYFIFNCLFRLFSLTVVQRSIEA